ncbi:GMC family oxidoreductase N-terminal domain-containing protein [Kitasatospora sp. NPDC059160]|uniref:GMC family oxidoreductase N-terminal domain-containing protein n=1 Tax=Kitasatospora sp. NPDC059160 TaxID=3346748 RepID=UPI0036D095CC
MTGTVRTVRCDALVIGSGAGGSTAALELAGAGREVHVLEEGPLVPQTRITRASPAENLRLLYRQGGLVPIHGAPTIPFGEGRCVGGTTVVNGGLLWRPPEHLLECWASAGVDGFRAHHLAPHLAEVERRLGVVDQQPGPGNRDSVLLGQAADRLGWRWAPARRAVRGCRHANRCVTGCPTGAKQSMLVSYLPAAERLAAVIEPDTRVVRLEHDGTRVTAVHALRDGRRLRYLPQTVFLAAGPIGSALLLRRSAIGGRGPGRAIAFHVNFRTVARFGESVRATEGTIFTAQLQEFADRGVRVMPANLTPGSLAAALAAHPAGTVDRMLAQLDRVAVYTTQVSVRGTARLLAVPGLGALLRHRLTASDRDLLRSAFRRTAELLLEAGAVELLPPAPAGPTTTRPTTGGLTTAAQVADFALHARPETWDLISVHAMASCPMGPPAPGGVCDAQGRPHGFTNLRLCDASVLPGATGVSPQETIMGFSHLITARYLERSTSRRPDGN